VDLTPLLPYRGEERLLRIKMGVCEREAVLVGKILGCAIVAIVVKGKEEVE
jgi:hypothetical protein